MRYDLSYSFGGTKRIYNANGGAGHSVSPKGYPTMRHESNPISLSPLKER